MQQCDISSGSLAQQMASTPLYRMNGLPRDTGHVIIFATRDNAVSACEAVAAHCPQVEVEGVCVHKGEDSHIVANLRGTPVCIPVLPPGILSERPHCLGVLFWSGCVAPDLLYHLETAVRQTNSIVLFPRVPLGVGRRRDAHFYTRYREELDAIHTALADEESRLSFAATVKALITGEIGFLRPPQCPEYQHPAAAVRPGDIVLDAGLFDSTVLRRFALTSGPQGHVYGFEPEPHNYASVEQSLNFFGDPGNITLVRKGLFSRRGSMRISCQGASGRLLKEHSTVEAAPCEVIDVDGFAREYSLPRIDLIKMDIEGAEMDALHGAAHSIRIWKPRLHICAYHRPDDLVDIPEFINSIAPDYRFYFVSHAPYLNEYVYYGVHKESNHS